MMMSKSMIIVLTVLVMFSVSCTKEEWEGKIYTENGMTVVENWGSGLWDDKFTNADVKFEENLSIGVEIGEESLMFNSNPQVSVDADLNIYILDDLRILKFDENGNFIWKTGRKGQGPGEFQRPRSLSVSPSGEICILDNFSFLHFFNNNGNYLRTLKLREFYRRVHILPDGRLLIERMEFGQPRVAASLFSKEGGFLKKFFNDYYYGQKNPAWKSFGPVYSEEGFRCFGSKIYFSLPDRYEIREYDLEGRILRKIRREVDLKPPEINASAKSIRVSINDRMGPCFLFNKNFMVNQIELVEDEHKDDRKRKTFLDFFNEKGQFLGSCRLSESMELYTIDSENNFYFVQNDPFPRIIRSTIDLY